MDDRIRQILSQISHLEEELHEALHTREQQVFFTLNGKRIEFESAVKARHRALRMGVLRWLVTSRPQNVLSVPFIYAVAIPFVLLDVFVSIYQAVCFPLYGIPKVKRSDYIVFDRHQLGYLNIIEKINCEYCAYGNGVLAFVTEVAGRTEQYWCPIKHARKVLGRHERYHQFTDFGDGERYQEQLKALRLAFRKEAREARARARAQTKGDGSAPPSAP